MSETNIQVRPNGPLRIEGPFTITDPTGVEHQVPAGATVILCRCGQSTEKPFCTGAHRDCGWAAEEPITRTFE